MSDGKTKTVDKDSLPSLPKHWRWATLGELAANEPGAITDGPFGSKLKTSHYTDVGPRVIRLQNIGDGFFRDEYAHISSAHFETLKKHEVIAGDIAIAALGETLPRSCLVPSWVGPAIVKADCPRFRPNRRMVTSEFINYVLNSPGVRRRTSDIIHGVGRPRLNLSEVRGIWVPLAPLSEQRRIVAKIEELFSDLDAGVAALERAKANLKRYRASVLKAAVEGRLTAAWREKHPNAEPAAKLLERILTKRRKKWEADQLAKFAAAKKDPPKGWREKYAEPATPDMPGLPKLPSGWSWATVGQIGDVQGGIQKQPKRVPKDNAYPYLRVANVLRNRLKLDDVEQLELFGDELSKLRLEVGDMLIVEGNGSKTEIGRSALWNGEVENCVHQNHIIRVRLLDGLSKYLNTYWNSPSGNGRVMEQAASTSGLYTLSVTKVTAIAVPVPPREEQREIITEVERRLSTIDAAETAINHDLLRATRLRQSILKRAFEGKLVPQTANEVAVVAQPLKPAPAPIPFRPPAGIAATPTRPRKLAANNIFYRGAIASYVINKLAASAEFGRTQLEKVLHLAQSHLGIDLALEFKRYPAGPFDEVIYKIEGFARKQGWFAAIGKKHEKVTYKVGNNIQDRCRAAVASMRDKQAAMDQLLEFIAHMDTDQAELFSTVYAAWNDLLIDGRPTTNEAIIAEVYGWHATKKKFTENRIIACVAWMTVKGYAPKGEGKRTQIIEKRR